MDFISADQALELLKSNPENYTTPDSIRGLINRVDMNTPGEITLLYSGYYTDGGLPTSANGIVQAMAHRSVLLPKPSVKFVRYRQCPQ